MTDVDEHASVRTAATRRDPRLQWLMASLLCLVALAVLGVEAYEFLIAPKITNAPAVFSDLKIYRGAVDYWWHGGGLYNYASDNPKAIGLGFTYPPFAATVFLPMLAMPQRGLEWVWTIGTFVVIVKLALSLRPDDWPVGDERRSPANSPARRVAHVALAAAMLGLSYPIFFNLILGQVSVFVIASAFLDVAAMTSPRWRGSLVGLAAAVKLTPLIFIPYFLVTRQWRATAIASVTSLSAGVVAFLISPGTSITYWTAEAIDTARMGQTWLPWNKSTLALIARWHAGGAWQGILWISLCLILVVHGLLHAWRLYSEGDDVSAALLVGCTGVAVSPISWDHHQIWGVLVAVLLATSPRLRHRVVGAVLFVVFFIGLPLSGRTKWLEGPMPLTWRIAMEVPVASFMTIVVLGLPPKRIPDVGAGPAPAVELMGSIRQAR